MRLLDRDMNINKIPPPYISDEANSSQCDFDDDVKQYCESLRSSQFKIESRASKVIILGNVGAGKSSLLQRFVYNSFSKDYKSTIGVDFEVEIFRVLGLPFNMQIWDTAGQERFKCIASAYYRGAQAILIVFDLTDRVSLLNTENWLRDALKVIKYDEDIPHVFLIGTKKDLVDNFDLDRDPINQMAIEISSRLNAEYWPCSSATGENINRIFYRLAALLFDKSIKNEIKCDGEKLVKSIGKNITSQEIEEKSRKKSEPFKFRLIASITDKSSSINKSSCC